MPLEELSMQSTEAFAMEKSSGLHSAQPNIALIS
jgi:hypothetical protein